MTRNHITNDEVDTRSWVVIRIGKQLECKPSRWEVGYTVAHKATAEEAIEYALDKWDERSASFKLTASACSRWLVSSMPKAVLVLHVDGVEFTLGSPKDLFEMTDLDIDVAALGAKRQLKRCQENAERDAAAIETQAMESVQRNKDIQRATDYNA
jgi:hypothetical protein